MGCHLPFERRRCSHTLFSTRDVALRSIYTLKENTNKQIIQQAHNKYTNQQMHKQGKHIMHA